MKIIVVIFSLIFFTYLTNEKHSKRLDNLIKVTRDTSFKGQLPKELKKFSIVYPRPFEVIYKQSCGIVTYVKKRDSALYLFYVGKDRDNTKSKWNWKIIDALKIEGLTEEQKTWTSSFACDSNGSDTYFAVFEDVDLINKKVKVFRAFYCNEIEQKIQEVDKEKVGCYPFDTKFFKKVW